jgi:hypothetical protein
MTTAVLDWPGDMVPVAAILAGVAAGYVRPPRFVSRDGRAERGAG